MSNQLVLSHTDMYTVPYIHTNMINVVIVHGQTVITIQISQRTIAGKMSCLPVVSALGTYPTYVCVNFHQLSIILTISCVR